MAWACRWREAWQGPYPGDAPTGCTVGRRSEAASALPMEGSEARGPLMRGTTSLLRQERTGGGIDGAHVRRGQGPSWRMRTTGCVGRRRSDEA